MNTLIWTGEGQRVQRHGQIVIRCQSQKSVTTSIQQWTSYTYDDKYTALASLNLTQGIIDKMKREAKVLMNKALDSLFLSIDHFNRPYDRGRPEAVLIFLDRAFELLLKSAIVERGGKIRGSRDNETIGFDKCVRKCVSEENLKCINEEEAFLIQSINILRDAAQHYWVDLSEQHLYLHAQGGLTLFGRILRDVYSQRVTDYFPDRVLPVSSSPPQSLATVFDAEFADIKRLCKPRSRRRLQAAAKLRGLAVLEKSLAGERTQPSDRDLQQHIADVQKGLNWNELFPGIATLQLETKGLGFDVSLRLTKDSGEPVRLVDEGNPNATVVGVKRVNELDYYNLGMRQLAKHTNLTVPKCLAVVRHLGLQDNNDYFKVIRIGSQQYKRYSQQAISRIREELPKLDIDEVWRHHRPSPRA